MKFHKYILSTLLLCLLTISTNAQELLESEQPEVVEHALYGWSSSLMGDWAMVGAPQKDIGNYQSAGSVLFYQKINDGWNIALEASPLGLTDFANFGASVSLGFNDAFVGATGDHEGGIHSGAVYVYEYNDTTWVQAQKLKASDTKAGSRFGVSLDLNESIAVIGANQATGNEAKTGAVYIFEKADDTWTQTAKLMAEDGSSHDSFGYSVTMVNESIIAVGAYNADGATERTGVVYIFEKEDEEWEQTAKLYDVAGASSDLFGYSITASEVNVAKSSSFHDFSGFLYVGAPGTINENGKTGSVYLYQKEGDGSWELNEELIEESSEHNDHFGISVAANNYGGFYVGASRSAQSSDSKTGTVYQYEIWPFFDETPESEVNIISITESGEFDNFGYQVAADELSLLVSSPHADQESATNTGKVYFFDFVVVSNEDDETGEISDYKLNQNYPNPFNPSTTISYQVKEAGLVTLTIYNLLGQAVQVLVNETQISGSYSSTFDASALSSGFYFYRLEVNDFTSTKKMMLIK
ncbi:MAG: T9SS type A sorting domain-containing protein [Balneolaceae bacterium]